MCIYSKKNQVETRTKLDRNTNNPQQN